MPNKEPTIELDEAQILKCVERIAVTLHDLAANGCSAKSLLEAINVMLVEMVNDGRGGERTIVNVMALYPTLSRKQWDQIELGRARFKTVRDDLRREGFTEATIIWSLIVATRSVLKISGATPDDIDTHIADLIGLFRSTGQSSLN